MKKIIVLFAMIALPGLMFAQETPLSSVYFNYADEPGFEATEIRPGSEGSEWEQKISSDHFRDLVNDITSIRILEYKGEGKVRPAKIWKKMSTAAGSGNYTEIVNFSGDDEQALVYISRESAGIYSEIALMAREENDLVLITVTGNIDLEKIFSPETMKSLRELGKHHMKGKGECEVR